MSSKLASEKIAVPMLLLLLAVFSVAAYGRNSVWGSGMSLWSDAIEKSGTKPRPYNNLGEILSASGDLAGAEKNLLEAVRLFPQYSTAHYNLGLLYGRAGRLGLAERSFVNALRYDESNSSAHNNLGNIYHMAGELDQAVSEYRLSIETAPGNVEARFNLAAALEEQGRIEEALQVYRAFLKIAPREGFEKEAARAQSLIKAYGAR